jgi:transposase
MGPYSLDLRERVVKAVDEGQSTEEVAIRYEIGERTVRRYLKRRKERGNLGANFSPGRPREIDKGQEMALLKQSEKYPDATLEKHCERWEKSKKIKVSPATMCRSLQRLGQTRKKRPSVPLNAMK